MKTADEGAFQARSRDDTVPLSEKELRVVERRIEAARRLARKIGLAEGSEFGRLVAEIRRWRGRYGPRKLTPAKERKRAALTRRIKADVAEGRRVTLITLSVADMEQTAAELTAEELRLVRFDIPGLCLAARKEK